MLNVIKVYSKFNKTALNSFTLAPVLLNLSMCQCCKFSHSSVHILLIQCFYCRLCICTELSFLFFPLLIRPPRRQPEGSYKIVSVCPFDCLPVRPSVCPGVFLELSYQFFLNFGMVLETYMKLCVTEPDFPGNFFCPQNWENGPKMGQKQGFLNVLKYLADNFY